MSLQRRFLIRSLFFHFFLNPLKFFYRSCDVSVIFCQEMTHCSSENDDVAMNDIDTPQSWLLFYDC